MPWVGFERKIPVFDRAKTVHALERAATVNGKKAFYKHLIFNSNDLTFWLLVLVFNVKGEHTYLRIYNGITYQ
jgi:hypothetical protein